MGVLDRLESPVTGNTLFTFEKVHVAGNRGGERRNATYSIANAPYGSSPFLATGAPDAPHRWRWSALFVCERTRMSVDAVIDTLDRALDLGRPVRLVYLHDDGYERINDAIGYLTDAPIDSLTDGISVEIAVEWELLAKWRERASVNAAKHAGAGYRAGQTGVRAGSLASVQIASNTFTLPSAMCDASVAGPGGVPTASDTGPIFRISDAFGGDGGFTITGGAPVLPWVVSVNLKLVAGDLLVLDFGAKDYTLTRSGTTIDVSTLVTTNPGNGYDAAIQAGVQNPITLACVGTNPTHGGSVVVQWRRFYGS